MIGTTLAHYQITAHLGSGGMGEVYRATDTKLGREVAIKLLPEAVARDPERVARFEREARTLATLQHPNVASIYGLEQAEGHRFLVMELAEGEDLQERLQRGAVTVTDVVSIALQIATGLEAAHEKGIVHRDLKPANIKLATDGSIKILDFGLARAFASDDANEADLDHSPTITAAMTQAGVILGTAAYMSPEQARGKAVDKRADIWAYGVILYEMLTGQRLFAGDTLSDTLAGVLKTPLDLAQLPATTPPKLAWLVQRCLDRDPKTRLRDIGEARVLLEAPLEEPAAQPAAQRSGWPWLAVGVLAGVVLGALGLRALSPSTPGSPPPLVKFQIPVSQTTGTIRSAVDPAGTRVVFADQGRLRVRAFDQLEARDVPGVDDALVPAWSPDGTWIAYATGPKLYKIRPDGTDRFLICDVPNSLHQTAGGIVWLDDGRVVFSPGDSGLWSVSAQGGAPEEFLKPGPGETDFHTVSALPGDRGFLFVPHANNYFDRIALFANGERKELLVHAEEQVKEPIYLAGHLVYGRRPVNDGLWAVPFSLSTLSIEGEPFLVVPHVQSVASSSHGVLAYASDIRDEMRQLAILDRQGNVVQRIGEPVAGLDAAFAVSPNEQQIAVAIAGETQNLWIYDVDGGARRRFTFEGSQRAPQWFPDGDELIYAEGPDFTHYTLERRKLDGSNPQSLDLHGLFASLSRDGQFMVYTSLDSAANPGIGWKELTGAGRQEVLIDTNSAEFDPHLSPDGHYVAYGSNSTGREEIYVVDFPQGQRKWQVSQSGGRAPHWSHDGTRLCFREGPRLYEVAVRTEPSLTLGPPKLVFENPDMSGLELSKDPDRFFVVLREAKDGKTPSIQVWLNWGVESGVD